MSISTLSGIQAGLQPKLFSVKVPTTTTQPYRSLWSGTGNPGAGGYDTTLNGVTCDNTTAGALPFVNPASGNSYLSRMEVWGTQTAGWVMLCDRLWHNGGYTITSTSAQNSTTPTWPARDIAGSTNGDGVLLGLEISSTVGAATPTVTVSYTNSSGTAGRTGTNIYATVSASQTHTWVPIGLQAGDTGVRSVESVTLSASWISGTMNLFAYRPIQMVRNNDTWGVVDAVGHGHYRIYNSSCLFFLAHVNTSNQTQVWANLDIAQG